MSGAGQTTEIITNAGALLSRYDAVLCDIWGVLHDGVTEYRAAGAALERYRAAGGAVILLSNSPAPSDRVAHIVASKHVRRSAWDRIVSSGDLSRARMRALGCTRIQHIGPERDLSLFEGQDVVLVDADRAEAIVATGLIDDTNESAENYREPLAHAAKLGLPLICANPDRIVDVGGTLVPCAGALGDVYEELGGTVYWEGKPMAHAYDAAVATASELLGAPIARHRLLAIGDSFSTDMTGAATAGIDALLIAHGIHREALVVDDKIHSSRLMDMSRAVSRPPVAAMVGLSW